MVNDSRRDDRGRPKAAQPAKGSPPTRKRWGLRLLAPLALLAALVLLLPTIVTNTPLLPWGLKLATADVKGSVTVQSASLGWFSPINVRGVEVKDVDGKPVFTLAALSGDRTLAGLLWNYSNLGRFRLESPKLSLVLRDDGSNAEDLLAKYLAPAEEKKPTEAAPTKIAVAVEIVDGGVSLTDQPTGQSWQVQKLGASFEMPEGADGPLAAKISADLPDARRPGKLTVGMKMTNGAGEATLSAAGLPLRMFRALAARFAPGTTLTGQLSTNLQAAWGGKDHKNSVRADLGIEGLSFTASALQSDVVQLERLRTICQASWQSDRLEIENVSLDCDLGSASLSSTIVLDNNKSMSADVLLRQRHEARGRVDLARLARLLPATLHLRQQVEIKSGQVQLAFNSLPEQQGMKWQGQLDVANLTATAAGRQIAWERPMSLALDAHETPAGPFVDTLRCESDFVKIHAHGTPDALAASLTFNLKQLSDQLGQFVDLGKIQLAGAGSGNLNWTRSPQKQFDANADIQLRDFQLSLPNQPPWREDSLTLQFAAKGQTDLGAQTRIDSAALSVKTAADQIDAKLTQPVADLRDGGVWPVRVQMQGQLQSWPGRLAAWLPMKDCQLTGGYAIEVEGTASKQSAELRQVKLAAAPLIVNTPWLNLNEPQFNAAMAGSWNQSQRRLQIEPASLTCATVAIQANNVLVAMPEKGPMEMAGALKYQGDVARIRRWFSDPAKRSAWQLAGQLNGTAQVQQSAGVIRGETTTDLSNLAVVDASGQQFQEPRIRLVARGDYSNQTGVLQLEQCDLSSEALSANAAGRLAPVSGEQNADLKGRISYDLERLAGLLRPYIGSGVRIAGRNSSALSYRGPFSLSTGSAAAGVKWDRANIYGVKLGPGELKTTMANGQARIEPLDLPVNQGRVHLAPQLRMSPDPIELSLPKGPLAERIQIDPELCSTLLKYIAPVLADVASAQGSFSVELDGCRIPLKDPAKGELAGRFIIHTIEVGPGPLVRSLATFLGRETPAKLRQESVVLFRLVGGRVYHQGLELVFPEFTIRTYGSVGLDQSMAIMAEMPVPPKWLEKNPAIAQALRNEIIRVPINGTLSKPQVDPKVAAELSRKFLQKAAGNMIEGELNKQLDRLFGPKK